MYRSVRSWGAPLAALVASIAFTSYAVLAGDPGSDPGSLADRAVAPTPTLPVPSYSTEGALSARLQQQGAAGKAANLILAAASSANVELLLDQFRWQDDVCVEAYGDKGDVPLCAFVDLAPGTKVQVVPLGLVAPLPAPREFMRVSIDAALKQGNAKVSFVSSGPENLGVALTFPAVELPAGEWPAISSFWFEISAKDGKVTRVLFISSQFGPADAFQEGYQQPTSEVWFHDASVSSEPRNPRATPDAPSR